MVACQTPVRIRDVDARADTVTRGRCSRDAHGAETLGELSTGGPRCFLKFR